MKTLRYIVPTGYLLIVGYCIWRAMLPQGLDGLDWFGACMVLTLPWSVITFFLIKAAIHVLGDSGIFVTHGIAALINAGLLYLIFSLVAKKITT